MRWRWKQQELPELYKVFRFIAFIHYDFVHTSANKGFRNTKEQCIKIPLIWFVHTVEDRIVSRRLEINCSNPMFCWNSETMNEGKNTTLFYCRLIWLQPHCPWRARIGKPFLLLNGEKKDQELRKMDGVSHWHCVKGPGAGGDGAKNKTIAETFGSLSIYSFCG